MYRVEVIHENAIGRPKRQYAYDSPEPLNIGDRVLVPGPPWDPSEPQEAEVVKLGSCYTGFVKQIIGLAGPTDAELAAAAAQVFQDEAERLLAFVDKVPRSPGNIRERAGGSRLNMIDSTRARAVLEFLYANGVIERKLVRYEIRGERQMRVRFHRHK